ncbi:MAG: DegQ family serine endoprotease [Verrucomicrobiae bacterium]|nr:DegQ family serine endoprotease [Verrucomicrobiae bacterium]
MNKTWKLIVSAALGAALAVVVLSVTQTGAQADNATPASPPPQALATAQALGDAFAWVAERTKPAVVSIVSTKFISMPRFYHWFFEPWPLPEDEDEGAPVPPRRGRGGMQRFRQEGVGSGVLISADGYILTAHHVVKSTDELKVFMADKREFTAKVVGTDPKTDLAVIKIAGKNLPFVPLGDSDAVRVGDWVIAVGSPYGLPQTVTAGIVSAKGRGKLGIVDYEDFIQTDTAINRGNSGGPLLNLKGEIVGVITAIYSTSGGNTGVGFAVPSKLIKQVLPSLQAGKKVVRGQLGVFIQDLNEELAQQFGLKQTKGVVVAQVNAGSAAEKAGIQPGDVITKYNGQPVEDVVDLRNRVAATPPGAKTPLVVIRKGKEMTLTVAVGEASDAEGAVGARDEEETSVEKLGLTVSELSADAARRYGYKDEKGVIVTHVEPDSVAAARGISKGDLILEVNRQPVTSVGEFEKAVKSSRESVLLLVKTKEGSRFVVLRKK